MAHITTIVGIVLCIVAAVFSIIAFVTPFYFVYNVDNPGILSLTYYGLFYACTESGVCASYTFIPSWWEGAQACGIIAEIVVIGAVICGVISTLKEDKGKLLSVVAGVISLAAGILKIAEVALFASEMRPVYSDDLFDLHASFGLSCVSAALACVACVPFCLRMLSD